MSKQTRRRSGSTVSTVGVDPYQQERQGRTLLRGAIDATRLLMNEEDRRSVQPRHRLEQSYQTVHGRGDAGQRLLNNAQVLSFPSRCASVAQLPVPVATRPPFSNVTRTCISERAKTTPKLLKREDRPKQTTLLSSPFLAQHRGYSWHNTTNTCAQFFFCWFSVCLGPHAVV